MKQDPVYTKFAMNFATKKRETTEKEVAFLDDIFKKNKVRNVFDIACGTGRHAIPLAKCGYNVVGVDLSPALIKIANVEAKESDLKIGFHIGDMRDIKIPGRFDAAIIMWGSFTYLESITDMLKTLNNVNRKLKRNGILVIDVAPGWYEVAISRTYRKHKYDRPVKNGVICKTDAFLDTIDQFSLQHDEYIEYMNGRIKSRAYFSRKRYHFTPTMFDLLFRLTGFKTMTFYSDYNTKNVLPQKKIKRLIVVAKKI